MIHLCNETDIPFQIASTVRNEYWSSDSTSVWDGIKGAGREADARDPGGVFVLVTVLKSLDINIVCVVSFRQNITVS